MAAAQPGEGTESAWGGRGRRAESGKAGARRKPDRRRGPSWIPWQKGRHPAKRRRHSSSGVGAQRWWSWSHSWEFCAPRTQHRVRRLPGRVRKQRRGRRGDSQEPRRSPMESYVSPPGESRGRRRRHTHHLHRASFLGGWASSLGAGPRVRPRVPAHANRVRTAQQLRLYCVVGFKRGLTWGGVTAWGSPSAWLWPPRRLQVRLEGDRLLPSETPAAP